MRPKTFSSLHLQMAIMALATLQDPLTVEEIEASSEPDPPKAFEPEIVYPDDRRRSKSDRKRNPRWPRR